MPRVLKLALEGEQVEIVDGMFVAVPLSAQDDMLALSTESFGSAVKDAAAAVWERITKLLAAISATIKGIVKWLVARVKGDKGRKVNEEIVKQYEALEDTIHDFKDADPDKKMQTIAKNERLDEKASIRLSAVAHALLDDPKAYLGAIGAVEGILDEKGQQATVKASAMLVALSKLGHSHPLNEDDGVQKEISAIHDVFEPLPAKLVMIHDLITAAYRNRRKDSLPTNPEELTGVLGMVRELLSSTTTVETFERWTKEMELIEKDVDLATRQTKSNLGAMKGDEDRAKAQAMLDGYSAFWKELKPVLKALVVLDQLRSGAFQLTDVIIDYWKAIIKRTREEYKDQEVVVARIVDLHRRFTAQAGKLKDLMGH